MNVLKTNRRGVERLFPDLLKPHGWWPVIPKENADYYVLIENDIPMCFVGVVTIREKEIEIQGLYANKAVKSPIAVFQLVDWVGFRFMDCHIKVYVINDIAYFAWKKIGFRTLKQKKMKYWTAYWIEREAIGNGTTKDRD